MVAKINLSVGRSGPAIGVASIFARISTFNVWLCEACHVVHDTEEAGPPLASENHSV